MSGQSHRPWMDIGLSADQRAALLLREMTLEEKADLMTGDILEGVEGFSAARIERLGIPAGHDRFAYGHKATFVIALKSRRPAARRHVDSPAVWQMSTFDPGVRPSASRRLLASKMCPPESIVASVGKRYRRNPRYDVRDAPHSQRLTDFFVNA